MDEQRSAEGGELVGDVGAGLGLPPVATGVGVEDRRPVEERAQDAATADAPLVVGNVGVLGSYVDEVGVVPVVVGTEDGEVGVAQHGSGAVGGHGPVPGRQADQAGHGALRGQRHAETGERLDRQHGRCTLVRTALGARVVHRVVKPPRQDGDRPVVARAVQPEYDIDDAGGMVEVVVMTTRLTMAGHQVGEDREPVAAMSAHRVEGGIPSVIGLVHAGSLAANPSPGARRSWHARDVPTDITTSPCGRCGFTPDDYSARDLATSPRWLTSMTDDMVRPVEDPVLATPVVADALSAIRAVVTSIDVDSPDVESIHTAIHGLRDLGRILHDQGAGAVTQEGEVVQLNTSNGGVPKEPVLTADVGPRGLLGDRQGNRKHHGRPFQALCLWSAEVIDALAAEGHPIRPGAAGENITVSGVDWTTIRPGVRLLVGDVPCEMSGWAVPCRKNDQWFTGTSDRIHNDLHPGWSRAYAWVLEAGTITTGDVVIVEP